MRFDKTSFHALLLTPVPGACASTQVQAGEPVTPTPVHGLSYSVDGKQIMIPSHKGLAIFKTGRWSSIINRALAA